MRRMLVSAAVVLLCGAAARGAVIYDDFGPADAFNATGGLSVTLFANAGVRFTPATAVSPTDITVAMKSTSGGTITLSVCVDASGHPGAALASTSVIVTAGDPQVYIATFATPATLAASTLYWIKAVPSSGNAVWMPNTTGATGYSFTLSSGAWNSSPNGVTPAVRIEDNSAPATGACCAGSTCSVVAAGACTGTNTRFAGAGVACNAVGAVTPCCKADFNQSGGVSVQDIFDFLAAWFAGDPHADFNGGGVGVQDIFDFLAAWFSGC
jgi:hypothetical protein